MVKGALMYAAAWTTVRAMVAGVVMLGWNLLAPAVAAHGIGFGAAMGISLLLSCARSLFPAPESKSEPTLISFSRGDLLDAVEPPSN